MGGTQTHARQTPSNLCQTLQKHITAQSDCSNIIMQLSKAKQVYRALSLMQACALSRLRKPAVRVVYGRTDGHAEQVEFAGFEPDL